MTGMAPLLAKEFYKFLMATLPNLLGQHEDPLAALEELGKLWRQHRGEDIKDRSEEVRTNRAEIDKRLEERKNKELPREPQALESEAPREEPSPAWGASKKQPKAPK